MSLDNNSSWHKKRLIIAIDGPSGAGKGTISRTISEQLGDRHIDTGAMYRAVGWKARHDGLPLDDESQVSALARRAVRDAAGRGRLWAALMQRRFGLDVLACSRCAGRLRLVALIDQASVIERILRHLGLPETVPTPSPARAPPLASHRSPNFRYDPNVEAP